MSQKLRVNIVGIGPGNPDLLTGEARQAIASSNILIGDKRMLAAFADSSKTVYDTIKTAAIAEIAAQAQPDKDVLAVLVSGDVGFFSLAKTISGKLPDCECVRYCGISSLVYFSSKLQLSWDDAKIVSMHGRTQNLVAAVARNKKVFSLTGGENSPQKLCAQLCEHGLGQVQVYVGENLSYPEEKITSGTAEEISALDFPSLSVMMILNEDAQSFTSTVHGLADDLFQRSKVPMTKQEVRAAALALLAPHPGDCLWDLGAGTGSVSVELALAAPEGQVYAVERNEDAQALILENRRKFGLHNLTLIAGAAPESLAGLPAPDRVFVGGTGGHMAETLAAVRAANPAARVVISAIAIESLSAALAALQAQGFENIQVSQISVSRSRPAGGLHLMMAQNPVYLISGGVL